MNWFEGCCGQPIGHPAVLCLNSCSQCEYIRWWIVGTWNWTRWRITELFKNNMRNHKIRSFSIIIFFTVGNLKWWLKGGSSPVSWAGSVFMDEQTKRGEEPLRVAVFPWLAMGHLIPFLRLSESLSRRGHRVSFLSTPRNLQRLPRGRYIIDLVSLPLPPVPNLPSGSESAMDVPYPMQQLLKIAFDSLEPQLRAFLVGPSRPDWIIFDYASHWLPAAAAEAGVSSTFLGLFTAAALSFLGPPEALIDSSRFRYAVTNIGNLCSVDQRHYLLISYILMFLSYKWTGDKVDVGGLHHGPHLGTLNVRVEYSISAARACKVHGT